MKMSLGLYVKIISNATT